MNLKTCEALETIDRLSDVRYRSLVDNYLSRDAPAIITDAMDTWAVMNTDYFWFDNITHVSRKKISNVPIIKSFKLHNQFLNHSISFTWRTNV